MTSADIIGFLEGSFGAFLQQRKTGDWKWDETKLTNALNDLESHDLIERQSDDTYCLTKLGWIAGHGGIEVESVIRLISALRPVDKEQITDTTLIAATQLTKEVEDTLLYIGGSGEKELATWSEQLRQQDIPDHILSRMRWDNQYVAASRHKKAAACLLWITDMSLIDMETMLTVHGGKLDGMAGPISRVAERTHDFIHVTAAIAEHLHPGLDLSDRVSRLQTRLEVGIHSSVLEIAQTCTAQLGREDYQALAKANITTFKTIEETPDKDLLEVVNNDTSKMEILRTATEAYRESPPENQVQILIPKYEP